MEDQPHAVIVGLLTNNEVLLEKKPKGHPNEPNSYVFPGGLVESDETLEEAVTRELMEEYKIDARINSIKQVGDENGYVTFSGAKYHLHYFILMGWDGAYDVIDAEPSILVCINDAHKYLSKKRILILEKFIEHKKTYESQALLVKRDFNI